MNNNRPPDPRYPLAAIVPTSGIPDNQFGSDGCVAVDKDTGSVYVKYSGAWVALAGVLSGLANPVGSGSPEGVVTKSPGSVYFDTDANSLWYKKSGDGATGWVQLIA